MASFAVQEGWEQVKPWRAALSHYQPSEGGKSKPPEAWDKAGSSRQRGPRGWVEMRSCLLMGLMRSPISSHT